MDALPGNAAGAPESTCAAPPGFWRDLVLHSTQPPCVRKPRVRGDLANSDTTSGHQGLYVRDLPAKTSATQTTNTLWEEDALVSFREYDSKSEMRQYVKGGATPQTIASQPLSVQKGMRLVSLWTMLCTQGVVEPGEETPLPSSTSDGPPTVASVRAANARREAEEKKKAKKSELEVLEEQLLAEGSSSKTKVGQARKVGPRGFGAVASLIKQDQVSKMQSLRAWASFEGCFPTKAEAGPFVAVAAMIHKVAFFQGLGATKPKSEPTVGGEGGEASEESSPNSAAAYAVTVEDIAVFLFVAEFHSLQLFEGGSVRVVLALGSCCDLVLMKSVSNCEITLLKDETEGLRFRAVAVNHNPKSSSENQDPKAWKVRLGDRIKLSQGRYLTKCENDQERMLFEGFVDAGAATDPKAKAMELLSKMGLSGFAGGK